MEHEHKKMKQLPFVAFEGKGSCFALYGGTEGNGAFELRIFQDRGKAF